MKKTHLTRRWGTRLLLLFLTALTTEGCRYAMARPDGSGDVIGHIIAGDASRTAVCCDYPLRVNGVYPVFPDLRDAADFERWFPVVFDSEMRRSLRRVRQADPQMHGWDFRNWRGEAFAGGRLWRDGDTKRLFVINDTSASLYVHWKAAYDKDLQTLLPQYRTGCRRAAYYFVSEDRAYFGRVDILGELWTPACAQGSSHCVRARIMLFRRGQQPSEIPWRVFMYDAQDDLEHPHGRNADEFASEKEDFAFTDFTTSACGPDTPAMCLTFGSRRGKESCLRLEPSEEWPPRY